MPRPEIDPAAPPSFGFGRLGWRLRTTALSAAACLIFSVVVGVPHVQTTYVGFRTDGFPTAHDKLSANYWSVTGRVEADAGQYAPGCPVVIFVPLSDCVNLPDPFGD